MPESWTELPERFELTYITSQDGTHPRPSCTHAEHIPGVGWRADCWVRATHGYRSPVRRSMTTHSYDDYACAKHLDEMATAIAEQLADLEA